MLHPSLDYRQPILPAWITLWLIFSSVICSLDVAFTINRPYTNEAPYLMTTSFYTPWNFYSQVDAHYRTTNDSLTAATGRVMLIEIMLNFVAIALGFARSRHAIPLAFLTTVMVFWKTVIFLAMFVFEPPTDEPAINSNIGVFDKFFIFWVPNCVWIIMPIIVIFSLWNKLAVPSRLIDRYRRAAGQCRGDLSFFNDQ
ncbi:unnamed protein product [Caenorhabditis bovis]|uniref:EXPERA domain-containing protein n=1 Tax=Caenorhabditis bovis TaxID=2654633 RepID=A0A8S1EYZ3_9PELO|nr:unnamed protein product [Caenorhabditis bovis]